MLRFYVIFSVCVLLLAGCGGDNNPPESTQQTVIASPQPTRTASIFGATWTPAPSPTPLPRKTVVYTYVPPPTGTPIFLPTPAPTEVPPTIDPLDATAQAAAQLVQGSVTSNTALLLSADLLNAEAAKVLAPVTGSFIEGPPVISFAEDTMLVAMDVVVRGSGGTSNTRPVVLEASASPSGDSIRLVKQSAAYVDDGAPYEDAIGDFVLGSVDTALNNVLRERFRQSNPAGGAFTVVSVRVDNSGLMIRTDTAAN